MGGNYTDNMKQGEETMQRFGQVIGVKPEAIEEYERLHAQVWPEVLATIQACNIRNYTIFRHELMLFAYLRKASDPDESVQ
jgi:L-rhamnose mutarotase